MKSIEVRAEHEYAVHFVNSWLDRIKTITSDRNFLAVIPETLRSRVGSSLNTSQIFFAPEGETQKRFSTLEAVLEEMANKGLDRNSLLVGIGGGATTDLTGFAAASFMRGIEWIAVPTTVAGMVDAAIGGKTGINLKNGKNLAGAFHSPIEVVVDLDWISTLSKRDKNAGLAESAKCGFIADPVILDLLESGTDANIAQIIERSIAVKAKIVSSDFKESYEREVLNYGHTLGHAIERESGYQLRHGEAVSIGLCFAAEVSREIEGLGGDVVDRHYEALKRLDLPTSYKKDSWVDLSGYLTKDKKRRSEQIRFVTLLALGKTGRTELSLDECQRIYERKIGR